jgi:hypothetical protein
VPATTFLVNGSRAECDLRLLRFGLMFFLSLFGKLKGIGCASLWRQRRERPLTMARAP